MSVERDAPRGPTSEQLRRRVLQRTEAAVAAMAEDQRRSAEWKRQAAAAEAVLTAEDQIRIAEWDLRRLSEAPAGDADSGCDARGF